MNFSDEKKLGEERTVDSEHTIDESNGRNDEQSHPP